MKMIQIPGVEFPVSQFCLGCAYLGSRESEELSFEIMDYYYQKGGRFLNTAHEYSEGASERTVGKWVKERGVRSEMIVTSKGGEDRRVPGALAMHREDLLEDVDESLMRAGFDYFDFYLLHVDDVTVPVEEVVSTMEEIRKSGKIRYYGCSNWTVARQQEAAAFAKTHGMSGFKVDEVEMNVAKINRSNETCVSKWLDEEYIAHHKTSGMAVGAYSPIASGVLAKLAMDGNTDRWSTHAKSWYDLPYNHEVARRLAKLSQETGHTMVQLQLAYVLSQPYGFPNFAISGSATMEQLVENMGALEIDMTLDMIEFLHPQKFNVAQ